MGFFLCYTLGVCLHVTFFFLPRKGELWEMTCTVCAGRVVLTVFFPKLQKIQDTTPMRYLPSPAQCYSKIQHRPRDKKIVRFSGTIY